MSKSTDFIDCGKQADIQSIPLQNIIISKRNVNGVNYFFDESLSCHPSQFHDQQFGVTT